MEIKAGLSSKLFASALGRAMLEAMPLTPTVTKSLSVLLCSPAPSTVIGKVLLALRLFSSSLYFLLLKWNPPNLRIGFIQRWALQIRGKIPTSTFTNSTNGFKKKRKMNKNT